MLISIDKTYNALVDKNVWHEQVFYKRDCAEARKCILSKHILLLTI